MEGEGKRSGKLVGRGNEGVDIDVREEWGCVTWETDLIRNRRDMLASHNRISLELCNLL